MAKRRTPTPQEKEAPELLTSREDAESKIQVRINIGNEYYQKQISSEQEYNQLTDDVERWGKYNTELLKRMFSNDSIAEEYNRFSGGSFMMNQSWPYWVNEEKKSVADKVNRLKAISERLELIPVRESNVAPTQANKGNDRLVDNKKVFVVHGHDNELKETAARFLEKLELSPIILHEQANEGSTIIEKFERHADVAYALVLLTPDDRGFSKASPNDVQDRARQNVILELGYFFGRLGRKKVCALYKAGVELPSDVSGILYIPYDGADSWMFAVAKELRSAGLSIDLNKLM